MSPMPIGASIAMIFSLLVALTLTPYFGYLFLRYEEKKKIHINASNSGKRWNFLTYKRKEKAGASEVKNSNEKGIRDENKVPGERISVDERGNLNEEDILDEKVNTSEESNTDLHGYKDVKNLSGGYKTYSTATAPIIAIKPLILPASNTDIDTQQVEQSIKTVRIDACGLQCPGPIMGTFRTTFIIDEEGRIERIITPKEIKTSDHAAQIL